LSAIKLRGSASAGIVTMNRPDFASTAGDSIIRTFAKNAYNL